MPEYSARTGRVGDDIIYNVRVEVEFLGKGHGFLDTC